MCTHLSTHVLHILCLFMSRVSSLFPCSVLFLCAQLDLDLNTVVTMAKGESNSVQSILFIAEHKSPSPPPPPTANTTNPEHAHEVRVGGGRSARWRVARGNPLRVLLSSSVVHVWCQDTVLEYCLVGASSVYIFNVCLERKPSLCNNIRFGTDTHV